MGDSFRVGVSPPLPLPQSSGEPPLVYRGTGALTVVRGDDPGDYYCEHVFYTAGRAAAAPGSSIVRNADGEPLVGFLHVPGDAYTETSTKPPSQAERHTKSREVIAAAIAGYVNEVPASERNVRVLLSGFGPFESIVNNPTGDFTQNRENIDAAMASAFAAAPGTIVARSSRSYDLQYTLSDGRRVTIRCARLPVDDTTIDGRSSWSIQRLYKDFRPHAALHLGVATSAKSYRAEFHADNGGLRADGKHDAFADATDSLADNFSLERVLRAASPVHRALEQVLAWMRR